jgi:hypothetical protein
MKNMDLTNYSLFVPPHAGDVRELKPKQAAQYFDWFLANIPLRLRLLEQVIVSTYETPIPMNFSSESLFAVGTWFGKQVETGQRSPEAIARLRSSTPAYLQGQITAWELSEQTVSLCADVGIYFAEVLRSRHPHLEWSYFTKPKIDADLNQPVLTNFRQSVRLNSIAIVSIIAYKIIDGESSGPVFQKTFSYWDNAASL